MISKNHLDERQERIRGNVLVHNVLFVLLMLLGSAFVQDFEIYDIAGNIGFSEYMIVLACMQITELSIELILKGAYFGVGDTSSNTCARYIFTALMVMEWMLTIYDLTRNDGMTVTGISSIIMVTTIAICLWIQYFKERRSN